MPDYLMLLLMQITLFSSVTACILILVKQLFKWVIPPSVGVIMWLILLIRLIWPVFPESAVSVYNLIPAGRNIMYTLANDMDSKITALENNDNPYVIQQPVPASEEKETRQPVNYQLYREKDTPLTVGEYVTDTVYPQKTRSEVAHVSNIINNVILLVYVLGAVTAITVNLRTYRKARANALNASLPCNDERILSVYIKTAEQLGIRSGRIPPLRFGSTTMLVGWVKPTVIYHEQDGLSDRELSMIFAHELNHYKHMDNFVLIFSTYVASLFWYNPLIWIVRHMLREDIEVMCDSRTISQCDYRRGEYAKLIYSSSDSTKRYVYAGCHMSYGARQLKHRLRTISRNLENKLIPRIASSLLCVCIIILCLTNPIVSQNIKYADYIDNYAELTGESERTMHLTSNVSVASYLKQICTLLTENFDSSLSDSIGNGSVHNFKKLVRENPHISEDVSLNITALRTDQMLTAESCALINVCIVELLSDGNICDSRSLPVIPKVISTENMDILKDSISTKEWNNVRGCYNKGVDGANVRFEPYYTKAMFELILSRINDQASRDMWNSFYTKVVPAEADMSSLCSRLGIDPSSIMNEECLYVISPNVAAVEAKMLKRIIKSAYAGQDESAYYLKQNLEGYTEYALQVTLSGHSYTVEDMINDYTRLGVPQFEFYNDENCEFLSKREYNIASIRLEGSGYSLDQYYRPLGEMDYFIRTSYTEGFDLILEHLNDITFINVRSFEDDGIIIKGLASNSVQDAISKAYSLGLIDAHNGVVDLTHEISCGESLYYSFKVICSMINANR